jgi:hypothetical protein
MDMVIALTGEGLNLDVPLTFVGDFQAPDRLRADMSLVIALFAVETEIVSIGDTTYTRNPQTGEWDVTVGEGAFFISPTEFMGEGVEDLNDLVYVGVETLDGVSMYRLQGTSVTGAFTESESDFVLSFWIGVGSGLLERVKAEGEFEIGEDDPLFGDVPAGTGKVSLTVSFSGFGAPVSIEPPDLDAPPPAPAPAPPPTPTPPPAGATDDVEALRRLALDYWAAFNAYDEEKALSYLDDGYRAERESDIRAQIGQLRTFNVTLAVTEQSAPQLVTSDLGQMTLELKEPLGTRTILVAFIKLDGVWKIAFAEEIE